MDSDFNSARFALPLLAAAQAQKEITHNEALALIDGIVHPVIESDSESAPPVDAVPGQGWIVGPGASGDWAGQEGRIALLTGGAWRFVTPVEGMQAWLSGARAVFTGKLERAARLCRARRRCGHRCRGAKCALDVGERSRYGSADHR